MAAVKKTTRAVEITLDNNVRIEFDLEKDIICGIGKVYCNDTLLRNPARPWRSRIGTPEGIYYTEFRLLNAPARGGDGSYITDQRSLTLHLGMVLNVQHRTLNPAIAGQASNLSRSAGRPSSDFLRCWTFKLLLS